MRTVFRKVWDWYKECLIVGLRPKTPEGRQYRVKNLVQNQNGNGLSEDQAWETVFYRDMYGGCKDWSDWEREKAEFLLQKKIREGAIVEKFLRRVSSEGMGEWGEAGILGKGEDR